MMLRRWWNSCWSFLKGARGKEDVADTPAGASGRSAMQLLQDGMALQKSGETPAAVEAFVKAAVLFRDAGKVPQARAAMKLALRLHPFDPALRLELMVLESAGQPAEVGPTVGDSLADTPEAPTRRLTQAEWRAFFEAQGPFGLVADAFSEAGPTLVEALPTRSLRAPVPQA